MTPEELKEIEERYNVSRGFFQIAMKDIVGMGITSHMAFLCLQTSTKRHECLQGRYSEQSIWGIETTDLGILLSWERSE